MIQLLTYPDIDPQQWQALIDRSPYATWFQTKEAYEFYAAVPNEMKPFAVGVAELEVKGTENSAAETTASTPYTLHHTPALKGVIVGYITRERNPLMQYFTRRAIIIGGPLLDEHISDEALSALLGAVAQCKVAQCKVESVKFKGEEKEMKGERLKVKGKENGKADTPASSLIASSPHRLTKPIYIETRNFNDYSRWKDIFDINGFNYQKHLDYHINTTSLELAQSNIGKHRWRYIRLSMRDGAKIVDNPTIEQVQAFYTILQELYRTKVRTPLWSWEFFERLYHTEHARYILVELDGQIVGGTACVCLPGKAVYEWYACGLDNCRDDIRPLSVAIWGEMQYAAENGYPLFDFMGAGKPDEPYGVRDFKSEFGGELVEHGRFLCVRKPLLYQIGKWGVKILKRKR